MKTKLTKKEEEAIDFVLEHLDNDYKEVLEKVKEDWKDELDRWENSICYHEVGDRTYVAMESFSQFIQEHPTVVFDFESYRLASIILGLMHELYQATIIKSFDESK